LLVFREVEKVMILLIFAKKFHNFARNKLTIFSLYRIEPSKQTQLQCISMLSNHIIMSIKRFRPMRDSANEEGALWRVFIGC